MGNATDDVKAVADAICGHVAEDGIYHYCKEQGLDVYKRQYPYQTDDKG